MKCKQSLYDTSSLSTQPVKAVCLVATRLWSLCLLWDFCLFKMPGKGVWTISGQHFSPVSHTDEKPQIGLFIIVYWDIFELTFVVWAQYDSHSFSFSFYKLVTYLACFYEKTSLIVVFLEHRITFLAYQKNAFEARNDIIFRCPLSKKDYLEKHFLHFKTTFLLMIWPASNMTCHLSEKESTWDLQ